MTNEEIAIALQDHKSRLAVSENRIKDLEEFQKQQTEMIISVNRLADTMEQMLAEQKEQGERLKVLEDAPVKQWTSTKRAFFNAMLGSIGTITAGGILWLLQFILTNM